MTPPPAPSPQPPDNGDRHDTAETPVTKSEMRKAFRINEVWTFLVACGVALSAVFGLYRLALGEAEAAGRKGAEAVEQRVAALEQSSSHTRDDVHEVQTDIRSLYKAVLTGQRQDRLEKPPGAVDGGR